VVESGIKMPPKGVVGSVPGDVVTDLVRAKVLPDPYYRENEDCAQWVGESTWSYTRDFNVSAVLLKEDRVMLKCEGLDTLAKLQINGRTVGASDNMHRTYEWDVKRYLKTGRNQICVTFAAVNPYTRKQYAGNTYKARVWEGHKTAYPASVRKEACNFGWDWGPILVTCGIWRSISLIAYSDARIADVFVRQKHAGMRNGKGNSAVKVGLEVVVGLEKISKKKLRIVASLFLSGKLVAERSVAAASKSELKLSVADARLWWPNGMGAQPLYDLKIALVDEGGAILDEQAKRIGLRTLMLDRHKDKWGECFQFVVNGVPFFAKGANWIPVDALLGRRTASDYRRLLDDAAAANMNIVRVWGGGIYEDDAFYDTCDELGICVWQDFMFACMAYPTWEKAFMKNVEAEFRDNVRRIRHHACLALWCGNNELEQSGIVGPGDRQMSDADYSKLFEKLLVKVTSELSPDTAYWPSSPHSSWGDRKNFNDPTCGDAHLWDVWHGRKPFEWYRTCEHRFNSEFGFQSFPEPKTVMGYTNPVDRNITTPVMEHHQRSGIGNTTIMQYMLDWFRLPKSFEMTLWASQILQGMAIKYACEHWRRSMPRGMGTIYWQLNDVWPVASWASIDYHGRWKALQYMARHFFAPVLVSGLEDAQKGTVEIHVTSDRLVSLPGKLAWTVTDASGRKLQSGVKSVRTPVNGDKLVTTLNLAKLLEKHSSRDLMVWLELSAKGEPKSTNLVTFGRPKHLKLADKPGVKARVSAGGYGTFTVNITTEKPAMWVWLELDGFDGLVSDNFFHVRQGKSVKVAVLPDKEISVAEFRKGLRVRSLVDTF